eukprot:gene5148-5388_t
MAVPAVSLFGLELYIQLLKLGALASAAGSFISPLSAWLCLVLALNGAGPLSSTHRELWDALVQKSVQLPSNASLQATLAAEALFNNRSSALLRALNRQSGPNGTELVVANAVWANNTGILPPYAGNMMRLFDAPVRNVTSAAPINQWAAEVTRGLIKQAVPGGIKFNTVLTNAVYFKASISNGAWEYAFDKDSTVDVPFTTAQNKTVSVPMMYKSFKPSLFRSNPKGRLIYTAEVPGQFRAIKLPYKGGSISAIAVLPSEAKYRLNADAALGGIGFEKLLDPKAWSVLFDDLPVSLPKFDVKVDMLSLSGGLAAMGIKAAFSPQIADFERISDTPLVVSDVLQSVKVTVDEMGTTAAAVTSVVMVATSINLDAPEPLVFDRPFIFALVDDSTHSLLFLGTVKDPSRS